MKKRITAFLLGMMMVTSSFTANAAELGDYSVYGETSELPGHEQDSGEKENTEEEESSGRENAEEAAAPEEGVSQQESADPEEVSKEDEAASEEVQEASDEDPALSEEEEASEEETADKKETVADSFFTEEWLSERGIKVNDQGLFEYTDESGQLWIFDPEDPEFWKYFVDTGRETVGLNENYEEDLSLYSSGGTYTDPFTCGLTGLDYKYPSYYKTSSDEDRVPVRYGVDVSYYQGAVSKSSWQAMKNSYSVDFAFIRAGFRGYGSSGSLNPDRDFNANIQNAYDAGLKVGVYFCSQAITEDEAVAEADYCLQQIGGKASLMTLPIIIDYEYIGPETARLRAANLSPDEHTAIVNAFCSRIRQKGYLAGIYANKSMFLSDMNFGSIDSENYIWMAHWPKASGGVCYTDFSKRLNCWQFTDAFTGFGKNGTGYMANEVVDLDFWFGLYPGEVPVPKTSQLSFEGNGGSGDMDMIEEEIGTSINLPACSYVRDGCSFREWNLKADGTGQAYAAGDEYTFTSKDRTLYAIWECSITLDADNGTEPVVVKVTVDTVFERPENPVKEMYRCTGWLLEGQEYDFSQPVTRNMTLKAVWEELKVAEIRSSIPSGSEVKAGTRVYLSCGTSGADLYYTLDGTEPDSSSSEYLEGIVLTEPVTIKVIALKQGQRGASASFVYTIIDESQDTGDIEDEDLPQGGTISEQVENIPQGLWVSEILPQEYTGKAVTPAVRVYFGKKRLEEGTDYSVKYSNNVNAGSFDAEDAKGKSIAPTAAVTGKGSYSGTFKRTFTINPAGIDEELDFLSDCVVSYKAGKAQSPAFTVNYKGKKLSAGKDYQLTWFNEEGELCKGCKAAGSYDVTIEGRGNYWGSADKSFVIDDSDAVMMSSAKVDKIPNQVYTGSEIEPPLTVKYKNELLDQGVDYEVSYFGNTEIGTAYAEITGIGDRFAGSKSVTFKINGIYNLKSFKIKGIDSKGYEYTGSAVRPAVTVEGEIKNRDGSKSLVTLDPGTDYDLIYDKNVNAGSASVTAVGKGRCTGQVKAGYKIKSYDLQQDAQGLIDISFAGSVPFAKSGASASPVVTFNGRLLKEGRDYTVKYTANKAVADAGKTDKNGKPAGPNFVITGKGSFTGKAAARYFSITAQDISRMRIDVSDKQVSPKAGASFSAASVTDPCGAKETKLSVKKDYNYTEPAYTYDDVVYITRYNSKTKETTTHRRQQGDTVSKEDIIPAGAVIRVTVKGLGSYTGKASATYRIFASGYDLSKASVKIADQHYTGSPVELGKDSIEVTLKRNGETRVLGKSDYEIVSYSKNTQPGNAQVTLRGRGSYGGSRSVTFKILKESFN